MVAMVLLVVGNAIIRMFYNPFAATVEVVGWLTAVTVSFGLAYTQMQKGHVDIDLLVTRFPKKVQKGVQALILLLCIGFFAFLAWNLFGYALEVRSTGVVSDTLRIAYYPIIMMVSVGFFGLLFALVLDFVNLLRKGDEHGS